MTPDSAQGLLAEVRPLTGRALHQGVDAALQALIGHRLLTLLRLEGPLLRRAYSSQPLAYAEGGAKDIREDPWLQQILAAPGPVLSADEAAVRARFPDHAAIFAMGCGAVLNLPVRQDGRALGSVNLLHRAGWFKEEHAALAEPFIGLLAAAWGSVQPVAEIGR